MADEKVLVYVASPLGFMDSGRFYLKNVLLPELSKLGIEILNPWASTMGMTSAQLGAGAATLGMKEAMDIGRLNKVDIDRCDMVLAILDGTDVDSGTAAEVGYAFGKDKVVVGYRGDSRMARDSRDCKVNLQVEFFIRESGGSVHDTLELSVKEMGEIIKSEAFKLHKKGMEPSFVAAKEHLASLARQQATTKESVTKQKQA